jgi:hypothetical protein
MIDVAVASFETMYELEQDSDPTRAGERAPESAPPLS